MSPDLPMQADHIHLDVPSIIALAGNPNLSQSNPELSQFNPKL